MTANGTVRKRKATRPENAYNRESEGVLLSAMMRSGAACEVVAEELQITAAHFHVPAHQVIYQAILDLYERGESTDAVAISHYLSDELLAAAGGTGFLIAFQYEGDLSGLLSPTALRTHGRIVRDLAATRRAYIATTEIRDFALSGATPNEVAEALRIQADGIDDETADGEDDEYSIDDLLRLGQEGYNWLVPDVLEIGDVMMLTAGSGSGKSLFCFQFGLQVATGVHPFAPGRRIDPQPVLYIQLENDKREDGRRLQSMIGTAERWGLDKSMFVALFPERGLNLSTPEGMAYLRKKVRKFGPRLVIIAPWKDAHDGFGSHGAGDGGEGAFVRIKRQLDAMRRKPGQEFSLLIEAHASGASTGSQNPEDYQPRGTQAQVNWATYGLCLIPKVRDELPVSGVWKLRTWRGPRDRKRVFPDELREGVQWPWMPNDDEWR